MYSDFSGSSFSIQKNKCYYLADHLISALFSSDIYYPWIFLAVIYPLFQIPRRQPFNSCGINSRLVFPITLETQLPKFPANTSTFFVNILLSMHSLPMNLALLSLHSPSFKPQSPLLPPHALLPTCN